MQDGRLGPLKDDEPRIVPLLKSLAPILAEWKLKTGGEGLLFKPANEERGGRPDIGYPLHGDRLLRWPWMRQVGLHGKCSYVARANRGMASKWFECGEVRREPRSDCASGVELGGEVS